MLLYHPSLSISKKKDRKKKSLPTLPIFLGHVTGTRHIFLFGLMIIYFIDHNYISGHKRTREPQVEPG